MNEADNRLIELENQVNDLQSLSGGLVKLLLLSLSHHTHSQSLTKAQKETIRETLLDFMDEPALAPIFDEPDYSEEVMEIVKTMTFGEEVL